MKKTLLILGIALLGLNTVSAQLEGINPDYLKTLNGRAAKIVNNMQLFDSQKAARVQQIIVVQYYQLSKIHDTRDAALEEVKKLKDKKKEGARQVIESETEAKLYKRHAAYLAALSTELTQAQINEVKDGMTYGVLQRTYGAYLELLPDLTDEQKRYIYKCLVEAREFAMDAGSSKAKHGWFGKYKGRINNYLSKQGIDMKKAEEDLKKRKNENQ